MISPFTEQITFLHSNNIGTTSRFYEEYLHLQCVLDQGKCRIYRTCGTAYIGFCEHLEKPAAQGDVIVTLVTEDVDAWYQHLIAVGVECTRPPQHNEPFAIYHAFFRDPDGYTVELQRFDDTGWALPASK